VRTCKCDLQEVKPKKHFGQHFLNDHRVLDQLIRVLRPQPQQHFVEIGPGRGVLTMALVDAGVILDAIEIDRDLVAVLNKRLAGYPHVHLHQDSALDVDYSAFCDREAALRLVGNLPYNISTPLLFHLRSFASSLQDMHFMVQREVAERLVAAPDTRAYGRMGVMMQYRFYMEKLFDVGRYSFSPPPRVESAVVRFIPHSTPPVQVKDEGRLDSLVRAAFNHRRKTLRNAFHTLIDEAALRNLGIDPQRRPDTLSLREFARISDFLTLSDH